MFIFNWEGVEVKIRTKKEFDLFSDKEKVEYLNEGLEENDHDYVRNWLETCIPTLDSGSDLNIFDIQEQFVDKLYPEKLNDICKQTNSKKGGWFDYESSHEKHSMVVEFIEDLEDEDWSQWELFFVNAIYEKDSHWYFLIERGAIEMEGVKVTH